jgi:hypothetical protein
MAANWHTHPGICCVLVRAPAYGIPSNAGGLPTNTGESRGGATSTPRQILRGLLGGGLIGVLLLLIECISTKRAVSKKATPE